LTFSPGLPRGQKPTNPFHVEEFDADQLRELLQHAGFDEIQILGVHDGPTLAARPTLIAEQIQAALDDDWPAELEAFVAKVRAEDFVLHAADIDSSLDLVAVAR
jgi:hypothetical protein